MKTSNIIISVFVLMLALQGLSFAADLGSCAIISTSDTYILNTSLSGAPNLWDVDYVCIGINASNVVLDCAGFSIIDDGANTPSFGILVNYETLGLTNITVKNCQVSNYSSDGIYVNDIDGGLITNNSIYGNDYGFVSSGSSNLSIAGNNAYSNAQNGFDITSAGVNISLFGNLASNNSNNGYNIASDAVLLSNNTAKENGIDGFNIAGSGNNLSINLAYNNSDNGFIVNAFANNNYLRNNTAWNNFGNGFSIVESNDDLLINNSAYNNSENGFHLLMTGTNNLSSNRAYLNLLNGFMLDSCNGDILLNNTAYFNQVNGFFADSSTDAIFNLGNAYSNQRSGYEFYSVTDINASWLDSRNNSYGFNISGTSGILDSSYATNNSVSGFFLDLGVIYGFNCSNNTAYSNNLGFLASGAGGQAILLDNNASSNTGYGYDIENFDVMDFYRNVAEFNGDHGFYLFGTQSYQTQFNGNIARNNSGSGVDCEQCEGNFTGNMMIGNLQSGFRSDDTSLSAPFTNNTASFNQVYGFDMSVLGGGTPLIMNNTASSNGIAGMYARDYSMDIVQDHYFNNTYDILINSTDAAAFPWVLNLTMVAIDNPLGDFKNFTIISLYDNFTLNGSYSVDWTLPPSALLPSDHISFENKWVNISNLSGSQEVDWMALHWMESELGSTYNETHLELWKRNSSSWVPMNVTPDSTNNMLSLANISLFSDYGILENTSLGNCPVIYEAGSYVQSADMTGAPNDASEAGTGYVACVKIAASDVLFDCNGYNITNNGTASAIGIFSNSSYSNVTVANCGNVSTYDYGIEFLRTTDSLVLNSTVFSSTQSGIFLNLTQRINISGNRILAGLGGLIDLGNYTLVQDNDVTGSSDSGLFINGYGSKILSNRISSINDDGMYILSPYSLVSNNNVTQCSFEGIEVEGDYSNVTGNRVNESNLAFGLSGIWIHYCDYCRVSDNIAWYNGVGITSQDNANTTIERNIAYNNTNMGFTGNVIRNVTYKDNLAYRNQYGFDIDTNIYNASIINCTAHSNTNTGFILAGNVNGSIAIYGGHLYNNSRDFDFENTIDNMNVSASGLVFDNPAGSMENYTNLSFYDTSSAAGRFAITWIANSNGNPDADHFPFKEKFVNISAISGTVSIESLVWNWNNAEVTGPPAYTESKFQLWRYNGTNWVDTSASLNTTTNTLNISNWNQFSIFGIFQNNASENCPVIDLPGAYLQTINFTGSPNAVPELPANRTACVKINVSDVLYDCGGKYITGNTSANLSYGILVAGPARNVTIRNCPGITNYTESGVFFYYTNNSVLDNVVASRNNYSGISLSNSHFNNLTNSVSSWNLGSGGGIGIVLSNSSNNLLSNDSSSNNLLFGFYLYAGADSNTVLSSQSTNNSEGFHISQRSQNVNVSNSLALRSRAYGFFLDSVNYTYLYNNTVNGSNDMGIVLLSSSGSAIIANNISSNGNTGMYIFQSGYNNLTRNIAVNNSGSGIDIESGSDYCNLDGNNASSNNISGIIIGTSVANTLVNNIANDNINSIGIQLLGTTYSFVINSTANRNGLYGIELTNSFYNQVLNNSANGPTQTEGIRVESTSVYNLIDNNNVSSNTQYGIAVLGNSNNNNFTSNSADGITGGFGFYSTGSSNNRYIGNNANSNTRGFDIEVSSNNNLISDNNISGNSGDGITISAANLNNISRNRVTSTGTYAINLNSASINNRVIDNLVDTSNQGIRVVGGSDYTLIDRNSVLNCLNFGIFVQSSQSVNVTLNNASLNNYGIYLSGAPSSLVTYNNASGNNANGIYLAGSGTSNAEVLDNFANGNGAYGIHVASGGNNYNNLTNNTANENGLSGIRVESSIYDNLRNNTAVDNTEHGFYIGTSSHDSLLEGNNASMNGQDGFYVTASNRVNLTGNWAIDNNDAGIFLFNGADNGRLFGNLISENEEGILVRASSGNLLIETLFWNNAIDFLHSNTGYSGYNDLTMQNSIFSDPTGTLLTYTNLSLYDSDLSNEEYLINWTMNSTPFDFNYVSFHDKFVRISNLGGAMTVDSVVWNWLPGEIVPPFNASRLLLAKDNGVVWDYNLNRTPDTIGNQLSLFDVSTFSDYGILLDDHANISITKNVSTTNTQPNRNVTYTVVANNTGLTNLSLTIIDILPQNVNLQWSDVPPTSIVGQTVYWTDIVVLEAGQSFTVHYNVSANTSGSFVNNATAVGILTRDPGSNVTDNASATFRASVPSSGGSTETRSRLHITDLLYNCTSGMFYFSVTTPNGQATDADVTVFVGGYVVDVTRQGDLYVFQGECGAYASISVQKSGYDEDNGRFIMTCYCPPCNTDDECNSQCLSATHYDPNCGNYQCLNHQCVPRECTTAKDCNDRCMTLDTNDPNCGKYQCIDYKCVPGCNSDNDCPESQQCIQNQCKDVPCPNGVVVNHKCVECGSDSDCGSGKTCDTSTNTCTTKCKYACCLDSDCKGGQVCDQTTHSCKCPYACCADSDCKAGQTCDTTVHSCKCQYECCSDDMCKSGQSCIQNTCVKNGLEGNRTGFVGTTATVIATQDGGGAPGQVIVVTGPDGKNTTGKTDDKGVYTFPLSLQGEYKVTRYVDGKPVASIDVTSLPKKQTGLDALLAALFAAIAANLIWLLILLALILGLVLYFRRRQGERLRKFKK